MLLSLINLEKVRRAFVFAGLLLATIFVQNIILSRIEIFGVKAMIVPITVAAIGFFGGGIWGGVYGIIAGVITDMGLNSASIMMTVLFPVLGFFAGALPMFFMSRRLSSFIIVSLGALAITAFCQMFRYLVFENTAVGAVLLTAGLQVLWAVPFIFAIYYPCRALSKLDLSK